MGSIRHVEVDTDQLLSKLTLDEKVSLLAAKDWWRTPVIDRDDVFVPHVKTTDGPNGARGESYVSGIKAACFPCATNLGATFDVKLVHKVGQETAKEAITKSANVLLAPTLNVIRSPLGGRNYETFSEDPTILGHLAAAYINGCQSMGVAATPKHFVANDAENQRRTLSVEVDEQTLREIYLYPFQLLMKHSTPLCFMTSYNKVNGTYVSDSRRLIDDVLRKEWGFSGLVLSDWVGTYSTVESLVAGVDLEMPGPTKWRGKLLIDALEKGLITQETIDKSAKRVLELAKVLGRFDSPYEPPERAAENLERDAFIRDASAEGMVLLKNDKDTLPLPSNASIALIGYLATTVSLGGGGSARVDSLHAVTPLQGLEELGVKCNFHPGVPVFGALPHADPAIVSPTKTDASVSEYTPISIEWFNGSTIGTNLAHQEMVARAEYMIKEAWPQYLAQDYCTRMTFDVTPKTTGSHILSVITTGTAKCYIDGAEVFTREQETDLKVESFYFFKSKLERRFTHHMNAGQRYTLTLESWATAPEILNNPPLFGKMFQGAALRFFEYVDVPQAISEAASAAEVSDYAVICVGTNNEIESEGYDRETMDLAGAQEDLIAAVAAKNPRTIVVNFSGAPVTMTRIVDQVPAIVQAWFPGQECGHSIASVLTGATNPSGRLPLSWPKRNEDNPSFNNFPASKDDLLKYEEGLDIGYRYYDRKDAPDPLFPFGFGLSYTTFEVKDAQISAPQFPADPEGTLQVSCTVKNTGSKKGKAVVQFYVQLPETTIGRTRPVKELKAFSKVELAAGQEKTISVILDKYSLSIYDADSACWRALKGDFAVLVGTSSVDISTRTAFSVAEEFTWTGV
ncbi:hypothetical protein BP5796_11347 [Coleophoma crateriformis]|uniref:beta-glucosidase n=1 Tax=Coleophoma crateriformis TaxID=565419 RepID=A0A3D8QI34_9HELO|nr:hypothetical protein BP5796_11347 [Coleophoma crateriformis]